MAKKPRLTLVQPVATTVEPPRKLDDPGRSLWDRVMSEYDIEDRWPGNVMPSLPGA